MTQKIRIVAAILDTTQLNMYLEDGNVISIAQGDARLPKIIETAAVEIPRQGYADISLEAEIPKVPHFEDVEKKSNGLIRFFRVAKEKIKHLFEPEKPVPPVEPIAIGVVPAPLVQAQEAIKEAQEQVAQAIDAMAEKKAQQHLAAAAEIAKHAVPASDAEFLKGVNQQQKIVEGTSTPNRDTTAENTTDTIVAVVAGKVIPNMEKISNQFERASKRGSVAGVTKFLERLASVIAKRSHSVEDVLKFMERADLPIADDGTIVGYKVLRNATNTSLGHFVDCHTRKVHQSVGSHVYMDESLVDHNRNNECSNGLHVARRGYISGFAGDVCVVIKMNPEDVIAVPTYDANKIRVCGYHIIEKLSPSMYSQLCANKPMTDLEDGQKMLARVLRGEHIGVLEHVKIGGHQGTDVTHTKVAKETPKPVDKVVEEQTPLQEAVQPVTMKKERALEDGPDPTAAATIDPKAVDKVVNAEAALSKKDKARQMFTQMTDAAKAKQPLQAQAHANDLLAFKKAAKKSWDTLGINPAEVEAIQKHAAE